MERDFAGAHLTERDFLRLTEMCQGDPRLPKDYRQWTALVGEGTRQTLAEGRVPDDIEVDLTDFSHWCQRIGVHTSFDALRAYLIVQRRLRASGQGQVDTAAPGAAPQRPAGGGMKRMREFALGLALPAPLALA